MTDDDDRRVTGLLVCGNEETTALRLRAEHRKKVCRRHGQVNTFRLIT
jgi:hypothetical protein